ncbi:variable surface protein Vir17, truncated, putative, partial [Plasmodium vivax]
EVYEKTCPLNMFIAQIKNFKENSQRFSTSDYLTDIVTEKNEALTNIACSVYRGYTYLTPRDEEKRRNFCDYLNLWLDEQKSIHMKDKNEISDHQWKYIEKIWERLSQGERDRSPVCKRQKQEKNASEIKKRMNLMVYCVNRNYFKDLCEKSISRKNKVNQTCSLFSEFTNKYYANFYDENKCFDYPLGTDNYGYYISEDCDLNNIAKTFPKFDSNSQTILENDNVRPTINKCGTPPDIDGNNEHTEDDADVLQEPSEPDNALDESEDGLAESKFRHPRQEVNPDDHPVLFHLPSTDANLTENGPSKPIYYAGLSVSGVFFTSMVLYKYTALGPLIRSLVSKKEKLRQTTNKHLAEQWLQRTSEYMDSNSENSHYNFPYHSMQN